MTKNKPFGILVGCTAPTIEGRAVSEDDHRVFIVNDGSFTSLGNYYLWLRTSNELLRFVSYDAGVRLADINPNVFSQEMFDKLYTAVYMKLEKLNQMDIPDNDRLITTTKLPLYTDKKVDPNNWFGQFIAMFNQRENRR